MSRWLAVYPFKNAPYIPDIFPTQLGASVSMTLVKSGDKRTTHLITSRSDTGKVHQAMKMGIKIVTDQWLWRCFEVWECVPTEVRIQSSLFSYNQGTTVK